MTTQVIRQLKAEEIAAVAGGNQVCKYEVHDKCYVWGSPYDVTWEEIYNGWANTGRRLARWSSNRPA